MREEAMQCLADGKTRVSMALPIETVAKIRMLIRGKRVATTPRRGCKIRNETRAMSVTDFVEEAVSARLVNVKLDVEALKWCAEETEIREKQHRLYVKARDEGVFKIPPELHKKRGIHPGQKYPKFAEAMKKLGAERRAMTAAGIKWRKHSGRYAAGERPVDA